MPNTRPVRDPTTAHISSTVSVIPKRSTLSVWPAGIDASSTIS